MDNAPGWLPEPERADRERYWNGSGWTDRVRPAGKGRSLHLAEHVPDLQRALAAATADIDAVEDRLSNLFDRAESAPRPSRPPQPVRLSERDADDEEILDLYDEEDDVAGEDEEPIHEEFTGAADQDADADDHDSDDAGSDEDDSFAELDAALAAEEPEKSEQGLFRRRS